MSAAFPDPRIDRVLHTSEDIQAAVRRIGAEVTADYAGRDLTLITVLKGGMMFLADLCRCIEAPLTLDFMAISSYGPGAEGSVRITKDLDDPVAGRDLLVVEDIIDTGLTLSYLMSNLASRNPASLEIMTMFRKPDAAQMDVPVKYVGFEIPNEFVVGYGLDYAGRYRNLRDVGTLAPHVYA